MNVQETHGEVLARRAVEALKKNGFDAVFCGDRAQAVEHIKAFVAKGAKVGLGGSMTLKEIGIKERLAEWGAVILDHTKEGLSKEDKFAMMRAQLTSDLFLSSSNAVTLDGELVNIDGNGNRVAALTFGPIKTVVVVGINKLVADLDAAWDYIGEYGGPMNCIRLDKATPCAKLGTCQDCRSEARICRAYQILKRRPGGTDFTVLVVNERLGY